MIKLKTDLKYRMGVTINLPIVGVVEVSHDGYVKVDTKEKADMLVLANVGFDYDDSSMLNHVGSEEELVGQNDSLKDHNLALVNEKNLVSINLTLSEERNTKLSSQLTAVSAKLELGKLEITKLRADLDTMTKAYKNAVLGFTDQEIKKAEPKVDPKVETPKVDVKADAKVETPKVDVKTETPKLELTDSKPVKEVKKYPSLDQAKVLTTDDKLSGKTLSLDA